MHVVIVIHASSAYLRKGEHTGFVLDDRLTDQNLTQMPNPGGFAGSRLKFLEGEFPAYTKAVINNREDDFILDLWRRYFKRYPVDLADNVEPTEETLASVNDDEPDEELEPPNKETTMEEEYAEQLLKFNKTKEDFEKKKQVSPNSSYFPLSKSHDWPLLFYLIESAFSFIICMAFTILSLRKSSVGWLTGRRRSPT